MLENTPSEFLTVSSDLESLSGRLEIVNRSICSPNYKPHGIPTRPTDKPSQILRITTRRTSSWMIQKGYCRCFRDLAALWTEFGDVNIEREGRQSTWAVSDSGWSTKDGKSAREPIFANIPYIDTLFIQLIILENYSNCAYHIIEHKNESTPRYSPIIPKIVEISGVRAMLKSKWSKPGQYININEDIHYPTTALGARPIQISHLFHNRQRQLRVEHDHSIYGTQEGEGTETEQKVDSGQEE
ncbi:2438_t:CDS:2 [Acaulospora colombiana]|uniref:2438_t:CDS:1 n=1 Tax=Acaulospora colombiana TaxID=27376 RepID=A0ACA9KPD2_9GLOM|nr:2438_t:CDS:2 [Acaulospora colombiana]